jgi:Histidine kinase
MPMTDPGVSTSAVRVTGRRRLVAMPALVAGRLRATLAIGAVAGLLLLLSNGMRGILVWADDPASISSIPAEAAVVVGSGLLVALLLLVAISFVESGDAAGAPGWTRYALATLGAVGTATLVVHLLAPQLPIGGLVGWYGIESPLAVNSFVFANFLLFGGLGVFVYARMHRARRMQAELDRAERQRAATAGELLRSRLLASQAQVSPTFLFDTLRCIEDRYARDHAAGDRLIDDLIAFLRAALPQLRGAGTTLAREAALADAYLRIVAHRGDARVAYTVDVPPELADRAFPPMLILPLLEDFVQSGCEHAARGRKLDLHATVRQQRLRVVVADDAPRGPPASPDHPQHAALRARLQHLAGDAATLTVDVDPWCGASAIIELPWP